MKHAIFSNNFSLLLVCLLLSSHALAAPECYEQAKIPAHEFVFMSADQVDEVTGLAENGQNCARIPFFKGEPVARKKIYAPFGKLYEAYARAIEKGDANAAKRLYAFVRPTPRPYSRFVDLSLNAPPAPEPWGIAMARKIVDVLAPTSKIAELPLRHAGAYSADHGMEYYEMNEAWPLLFLLMGGEVLPGDSPWSKKASDSALFNRYGNVMGKEYNTDGGKSTRAVLR